MPSMCAFLTCSFLPNSAGVPGVKEERFEEGMTVKHCALSLVGEPIMYPEINRFVKLLHECKISSFLVTNAQFPAEIRWAVQLVTVLLLKSVFDWKVKLTGVNKFKKGFIDSQLHTDVGLGGAVMVLLLKISSVGKDNTSFSKTEAQINCWRNSKEKPFFFFLR